MVTTAAGFRTTTLPSGEAIPVLGLGTWRMAEDPNRRQTEIASLRRGLDLGMSLIDTSELYEDGRVEELIGETIEGRRDDVFLVSKVRPDRATRRGTIGECEASLRRLRTDQLDLYSLHWRGTIPLEHTLEAFSELQRAGKIRHWGVSNFDVDDMEDLLDLRPQSGAGGDQVETDQVLYNLARRGIEYNLLPWCQRKLGVPVMAYAPMEQGRILRHPEVRRIAGQHGASPAQVALAWVLRHDGVVALVKASTPEHVTEDRGALGLRLTRQDLAALDRAFPPPTRPVPLEILA
jgi:diketogulonate reductase-like aldo/keto reductase